MTQQGIHHVTAISGPARRNLAFHGATLGQRLVKKTVNFDDPGTYHLYYGNAGAEPGSILTFFPWEHAAPGRPGTGEVLETRFRVPLAALGEWAERLGALGVPAERRERFGEEMIAFRDPDGMRLAFVGVDGIEAEPGWGDAASATRAIRGIHGVGLCLAETGPTAAILADVFGFAALAQDGEVVRLQAPGAALGGIIDLHRQTGGALARQGGGSVHHIAFRAADDAAQAAMVQKLAAEHGIRTTEQKNRDYFRSVYFREPGGLLFEIATDIPGFAVDEPAALLGTALKLPQFLEPQRQRIEAALPSLA